MPRDIFDQPGELPGETPGDMPEAVRALVTEYCVTVRDYTDDAVPTVHLSSDDWRSVVCVDWSVGVVTGLSIYTSSTFTPMIVMCATVKIGAHTVALLTAVQVAPGVSVLELES